MLSSKKWDLGTEISYQVTIMIVSDSFRDFVRDCSYKISDLNKEKIKIFVESMFRKKVAQAGNDSLESWSHVLRQKPDDVISDDMLLTFAEHNRTRISTKARQLGHITLPSRDQMSLSPDPLSAPVDYQPTQLNHTTDVSTSADFPSFIDPNPRNVPNSNFSPSAGFDNRKISHKSPFVSKRQNCVEKTHKMLNKNTRNIKRMKSDTSRNITFLHNTSSVIGDVSSEEDGERVLASFLSTSSLKESEVNIEDHSQFSSKNFSGFLDSVNEPSVARLEGIKNADDISFNKLNGKKSQKNIITHNALSAGSTSIDYNINDGDHTNLNGKPCSISNKRAFILSSAKRKVKHKSKGMMLFSSS